MSVPGIILILHYLHGYWKVVLSFWWKEDIYSFLLEWCVACCWLSHFNNVQLTDKENNNY